MKLSRYLLSLEGIERFLGPFLFLFFSWYILALIGFFEPLLIWVTFLITLFFIGWSTLIWTKKITWQYYILLLFAFFIGVGALYSHPIELLAGRDQGSLAEAAVRLSQQRSFTFHEPAALPFFALYGSGSALHFPGFSYTSAGALTPQFPLGYPVWLAGFFTLFGVFGVSLANLTLFVFSVLLVAYLLRRVPGNAHLFFGTLLFATSFLPLWFLSFTLSENLSLTFFLLTLVAVYEYQARPERNDLLVFSLASALGLALTRIEGYAVLLIVTFFLLTHSRVKKFFWRLWNSPIIIFVFFGSALLVANFFINLPYFKNIAKALLKVFEKDIIGGGAASESVLLFGVLHDFGILVVLLGGLFGGLYFLFTRRFLFLLPFLLCLPALPYLLVPSITLDAPWMLRRFLFAIFPVFFLSFWWMVAMFGSKLSKFSYFVCCSIVTAVILYFSAPGIQFYTDTTYSYTVLSQTKMLAEKFTGEDLLLIDKGITGSGFMMPTFPLNTLYQRHSVYFFNPKDFFTLNRKGYRKTFILVPEDKVSLYTEILGENPKAEDVFTFVNDHSFNTPPDKALQRPETLTTKVLIFRLP